ncbi:MAG: DUF4249 domain-containing protein [Bacteroidia bacterium]|nr:DUF4249 domain-containing protein [Bacteroidia bacterium]
MFKQLIYLSLLLILFASCEEYYTPAIDSVEGQLVVEAVITNNSSINFVHLTYARNFSDDQPLKVVSGASAELVEIDGKVIKGIENTWGYFTFNMVPVVDRNYKLRIFLKKDVYESEVVTMPPLPTISNFYAEHVEKTKNASDGYNIPAGFVIQGREMYADIPVTNLLSYYRFDVRSILEWIYIPVTAKGPSLPPIYGWQSYFERNRFNLAGPGKFSQIKNIEKYPLLMLVYNKDYYFHSDTVTSDGWILIIDQFGTSKESFEYHEKLNSQFAADGNLFDPIQTQVYGNITCLTDHAKIVFGYFDLNSHQQYRYYYDMSGLGAEMKLRQIFRYPDISDFGQVDKSPPDWWEK